MKSLNLLNRLFLSIVCCFGFSYINAGNNTLAFPEAEGFGANASGGRGGEVVHVTNLNAKGAGSLADAVSKPNRIVVFDVGGVIKLSPSDIIMVSSNVTIAGQTAPGDGITVYGNRVVANGKNIIIRYLRMRGSINMSRGKCTFTCDGSENVILDHCSISWGRWDNVHIKDSKNVTFQYCIIGEGIDPQRFGAITDGTNNWTVSHCLWIDNKSRNPKMKCGVQYINNVVYNYVNGIVGGHSGADHYQDVINNYFIAGPSDNGDSYYSQWTETDHLYSSGNYVDMNKDGVLNGFLITTYAGATKMAVPTFTEPVKVVVETAREAYKTVLNNAGANIVLDKTDKRLLSQAASIGTSGSLINNENYFGGIGTVSGGSAPVDTDKDGMPDSWELSHGLNPNYSSDAGIDLNGDGYTNIEEYINSLVSSAKPRISSFKASVVSEEEIDLSWATSSDSITGYKLEKSLYVDSLWSELGTFADSVTSCPDTGLVQNTKYYYRLKVYKDTLSSDYTIISATTMSAYPISPVPSDGAWHLDSSEVVLSWNAPAVNSYFNVYIGKDSLNMIKAADSLLTSACTVNGLDGGSEYFWRVDRIKGGKTFSGNIWSFKTKSCFNAGMVGCWKFNESSGFLAADSSEYKNNGTIKKFKGNPHIKWNGKKCLDFSAGNDSTCILVPASDPLYFENNAFSISLWMKISKATTNSSYLINKGAFSDQNTAAKNGKWYGLEIKGGNFSFAIDDNVNKTALTAASNLFCTGEWIHVVAVRDTTSKKLILYKNGEFLKSTNDITGSIENTDDLYIANCSNLDAPFDGSLDDVELYNYAVSEQEVASLYKDGYVLGITSEKTVSDGIYAFTNPESWVVTVRFPEVSDNAAISVYNMSGVLVKFLQGIFSDSVEIDFDSFVPGCYMLKIVNKNNVTVKKIIKK